MAACYTNLDNLCWRLAWCVRDVILFLGLNLKALFLFNFQAEVIHQLGEKIGTKLARAEEVGAEGNVEESLKAMQEVEELKKKKAQAEVGDIIWRSLYLLTILGNYSKKCWSIGGNEPVHFIFWFNVDRAVEIKLSDFCSSMFWSEHYRLQLSVQGQLFRCCVIEKRPASFQSVHVHKVGNSLIWALSVYIIKEGHMLICI